MRLFKGFLLLTAGAAMGLVIACICVAGGVDDA